MQRSLLERITVDPKVIVGKPVIKGTRVTVDAIIRRVAEGETVEGILKEYPHITKLDVRAALEYARSVVNGEDVVPVVRRFDMHAFHSALDAARQAKGLSWAELAAQTNRPFEGTTSIPIHPATLRDMLRKRSVTSAVVLQALAWLGRPPESFLTGSSSSREVPLPKSGPGHVLRFDTRALHAALNTLRRARGLSWAQVAAQLPGFTPSMLTNLATGPLIGFPRVMLLTQWLGRPAADFVRVQPQ